MTQCSVCGKEVSDDLTIHVSRYHPLWVETSAPSIEGPSPRPWLAALLNIIPLGVGYYYLRSGWFMGVFLAGIIGFLLIFAAFTSLIAGCFGGCTDSVIYGTLIFASTPLLLISLITPFHAWHLAVRSPASREYRHRKALGGVKMMKMPWHMLFGHPHIVDFVCPNCGPISGGKIGGPGPTKGTRGVDEGMWRR